MQFRPAPEDPASRGAGGRLRVPLVSACACDGGQLRPLDEALAELLARAPRPPACESLALERALGRVLGEDLLAPMDLPHWDNSAMDGYACLLYTSRAACWRTSCWWSRGRPIARSAAPRR